MANDAPIFGPNGAVMNSETMTDDVRAEYEHALTFWVPSWAMFARIAAGLIALFGTGWLAAFWLPPQLAEFSGLSIEQAYIASAVIAILSYLIWVTITFRHHNRISLSSIWGAISKTTFIGILFVYGYETETGTRLLASWIPNAAILGYCAINLIIFKFRTVPTR